MMRRVPLVLAGLLGLVQVSSAQPDPNDPNDPNALIRLTPGTSSIPVRWSFDLRVNQQPPTDLWLAAELVAQVFPNTGAEFSPIRQGLLPPFNAPVPPTDEFSTYATSFDCFPNNAQAPACLSLSVTASVASGTLIDVQWTDTNLPVQVDPPFTIFRLTIQRQPGTAPLTLQATPFPVASVAFTGHFSNRSQADQVTIYALSLCQGDSDSDLDVDLSDLAIILANFGLTHARPPDGDTNGDGTVNLSDLAVVLAVFGTVCS